MPGPIDDLIKIGLWIISICILIIGLTFAIPILHFLSWMLSLNIPYQLKLWAMENTFALIIFLVVGIPTLIVTKLKRMW